jgi:uncharacterized membrane protein YfcA
LVPALIVLIVIGFLAQLVDGALGMAYGATSSTLLLAYGLSPATASASVHLAEIGTTAVSGFTHWRFGNVDWQTVRRIGIPGAIGAFTGAVILSSISAETARPWMAGILLVIGLYILLRFTLFGPAKPRGRHYIRGRYLAPLGLGAGFVDATGGGGWGPVATPTILATGKYEPRKVIGSVDASEFLVALAASIGFLVSLGSQGIASRYVVGLLIGGIAAAPIAAWLVRKVTPSLLGASVGGLILITNSRTLFDTYGVSGDLRNLVYSAVGTAWVVALAIVVRRLRRAGEPLLQRDDRSLATERA